MQHFTFIGNADVLPLRLQLEAHPEVWDQHTGRTAHEGSPHSGVSDCWLRWRPEAALVAAENYNEPFSELEWYPAIAKLPAARTILLDIMQRVGGLALGGTLITRIPSLGAVKPHNDAMSWHANYYHLKVYTVIRTTPNVTNWCAGESFVPKAGDCFSFDNRLEHAVTNDGDGERITMMTAIRTR